jgi:hypothetical protein
VFEQEFPMKIKEVRDKITNIERIWYEYEKSFALHIEIEIPIVAYDIDENTDERSLVCIRESTEIFDDDDLDDAFHILPDCIFYTAKNELIESSFFGCFFRNDANNWWTTLRPFLTSELWQFLKHVVGKDLARSICIFGIQGLFEIL